MRRKKSFGLVLPKDTPLFDRLAKQTRHMLHLLIATIARGKRPPVVVVYPDVPSRRSALHKMCRALQWELTNEERTDPVLCMRFEDETEKETPMPFWFDSLSTPLWNERCLDIRKSTLEKAHVKTFGYGMSVNPLEHQGKMVEKSDFNARHDGQTIQGPIKADRVQGDSVYQVDIDNTDENGKHFDYRLVFIKNSLPLAYKKIKDAENRFTNVCESASLFNIDAAITPSESQCILKLMQELNVDYAELDALRDAQTDKLFIIDVNPTPWGPPAELPTSDNREAIRVMSEAFSQALSPRHQVKKP